MNLKQHFLIILLSTQTIFTFAFSPKSFILEDTTRKSPENWFNLDSNDDKIRGVSTEKAYQTILKNKKSKTVIVAVIDSGIDIEHEDLKSKIWINTKEIVGNGKDDDNNGYVDDIYGWDFIGGKDGKDVGKDSYELTREYVRLNKKYADVKPSSLSATEKKEYESYLKVKEAYNKKVTEKKSEYEQAKQMIEVYPIAKNVIKEYLKTDKLELKAIEAIQTTDEDVNMCKRLLSFLFSQGSESDIDSYFADLKDNKGLDPSFDPRSIVGDNYENLNEKGYGNNEVKGPDAQHGTHVAGIIGADRNNNLGMKGVADNVQIMVLRAVPDGDERDKDIANAIRYAVDNGARVINMSFGKDFSPQKQAVDEAVKYAEKKNVLLVHAAGNDSEDIDKGDNFPTKKFLDNKFAKNWIEVGASNFGDDDKFTAEFSNYGQAMVDVFAPGVDLYATTPDQTYSFLSGTSMAAPVVSGVAALIMSYYPNLTAEQVKDIILKSAIKYKGKKVNKPGGGTIDFAKLSVTGAIVNIYEAVKIAETIKK